MHKTIALLLISLSIFCLTSAQASRIKDDETVLFFPGNAFLKANTWIVPIHGWIFEQEQDSLWRNTLINPLPFILDIEPDGNNRDHYQQRTRMFFVDNERGKEIAIEMLGKRFTMSSSQSNGHFYGEVQVANTGQQGWQTYQAITQKNDPRHFKGKAQFISPKGISVISDIDDTIKISNVNDKQALLKNTFFKEFQSVPAMATVYQSWQKQGAVFHYLSASPWHLYPALSQFIAASGFPDGSYNLKNFRVKDQSFFNLFSSQREYKQPILEALVKKYPERQFILIGDAGEEDPEIFATLAKRYPRQVLHIFIRDLNPDDNKLRYQTTFKGISTENWRIFSDGQQLLDFKLEGI